MLFRSWNLYSQDVTFDTALADLKVAHPTAATIIEDFFTLFNNRRTQLLKS